MQAAKMTIRDIKPHFAIVSLVRVAGGRDWHFSQRSGVISLKS